MSDQEDRRAEARELDAERRARIRVPRVNSATEEPPELLAENESGGHDLGGACWCWPVIETLDDGRKIEKHNTTMTGLRVHCVIGERRDLVPFCVAAA